MSPRETFENISAESIQYDCRFYSGYKPCKRSDSCVNCPEYKPKGFRILIIKLGAMGDVLRTTTLLPALRWWHNPCHITWITAPESKDLLRHNPLIDRLLTLRLEDVLALETTNFDLLITLDKDAEALSLAARVHAAECRGFCAHPEFGTLAAANPASMYALRLGLSDELKFQKNTKTAPEIIFEMAELPYRGEEYVLELDAQSRQRAAERFTAWRREAGLAPGAPVIGLNTGCGAVFATKQWTAEGFANLAAQWLERHADGMCLLLGGQREREFNAEILSCAASIQSSLASSPCSLASSPSSLPSSRPSSPPSTPSIPSPSLRLADSGCGNSLMDFMSLIEQCAAVVSSDSLGMHVAIGLRRPVVALFGPTCHAEVNLFKRGEKIVTDFPCAPCYLKKCPLPKSCMESLAPETVLAALEKVLSQVQNS